MSRSHDRIHKFQIARSDFLRNHTVGLFTTSHGQLSAKNSHHHSHVRFAVTIYFSEPRDSICTSMSKSRGRIHIFQMHSRIFQDGTVDVQNTHGRFPKPHGRFPNFRDPPDVRYPAKRRVFFEIRGDLAAVRYFALGYLG